jgi:hypothetical protein
MKQAANCLTADIIDTILADVALVYHSIARRKLTHASPGHGADGGTGKLRPCDLHAICPITVIDNHAMLVGSDDPTVDVSRPFEFVLSCLFQYRYQNLYHHLMKWGLFKAVARPRYSSDKQLAVRVREDILSNEQRFPATKIRGNLKKQTFYWPAA